MASFGDGLGAVIGGAMGHYDIEQGIGRVNDAASGFGSSVAPFKDFGTGFLAPTSNILLGKTTNPTIGQQRLDGTGNDVMQYGDFMKGYEASPGAKYLMGQAEEAQNNSAASRGKLLSGGNLRGLETLRTGLSNTFANQAYGQYLSGNAQQFGQLEAALGNMFQAIGVGTTATGQEAGVTSSNMAANASLAAAQAKNDQGKGGGIGSLFSGIGSIATMF